ncbi:MAG: hypothetical protein J1F09_09640 [Oscillospiraceae bacterium]|nr:hypothetical protein [Oscillospiraceae bacterium]
MEKLKMFLRRLFGGSVKKMFMHIGLIHKETGKNRVWLFFDMTYCIFRFKMGYSDYHCFGFAQVRGKDRLTFLTMNDNITLSHKLNSREAYNIFDDKAEFNKAFAELIGREWLDLRTASKEDFTRFCEGRRSLFAKPVNGFGGTDVARVEIPENADINALYERLVKNGQLIIEEEIVQHEKMKSLAPSSVNTLRIVTLYHGGELHLMYAMIRISNGENCVDNICSGGMYSPIETDGVIRKPAYCTATGEFYEPHPFTKTSFIGFEIPFYKESIELVRKASEKFPKMEYLGWDVAITPTGPILIEANNMPGFDIAQNYGHLDEKIGIKPRFEAILGKDFFK